MTSPQHYLSNSSEAYASLLHCLNTEQRKAGGYFQNHLENLESKVSVVYTIISCTIHVHSFLLLQTCLHCLLFWREVQEYKALFVGTSFSPCAVEMKAKVTY